MTGTVRCPVDALRAEEFPYVEASGRAYLDHTGAALPPVSLVRGHAERVTGGVFGNPHAASPASRASTAQAAAARAAVLSFCGASADDYTVVFTANATAAIRLVAEAFFTADAPGPLALLADNHNSVLGMRRYAARAGVPVGVVPLADDLTAGWDAVAACLDACETARGPGLFAYPAQSNASGVRHPLAWVRAAQGRGWRVLLDAAAHAPTGPLDLSAVPADFVCLSWYKITGYPPGVGCLVARHDALRELRRPWFSGGTVLASASEADWHLSAPAPERFEDGTLPFLLLPDVTAAVAWYAAVGRAAFARHAAALTRRLLDGLGALRHPGGAPMVRLLGPVSAAERGPTVAFHLLRRDGSPLDERLCLAAASAAGVDVRSGCFCNPGVAEVANGMTREIVRAALSGGGPADLDGYLRRLRVPAQGAVRASVGAATHAADVDRLLAVCAEVAARPGPGSAGPRTGC
ncbi:aminotransferase class V-fold PLP-dependent enzyme [Streptomyces johnsoniae]|uniref:Aminotransferase class V-fold PLP-dependent enzyme n=1 Tax=Streptomyces johnsoniae TaxID=3075532 RepID=A0ABU2SA80_9ACTN|nr:aminotransferase class V-fold PLP-dependent enzyme [Streptomyces sp. DSM 41886]MDT0445822.1 aminotransferase class V-fold PLP-dependent enzyme [Streptomyces sp. DSM 41886]